MPTRLILVRQTSAMRNISSEEVVQALVDGEQKLERVHIPVPMAALNDAVEQGDWAGHDHYLHQQALAIRDAAEAGGDAAIHYFGLAEVPHIVSLGAHLGDERLIVAHDHDRGTGAWQWPSTNPTLSLRVLGCEALGVVVHARGLAVVRIALSASITDADVRAVVGDETLADITITLADPVVPTVGLVRSAADVDAVRSTFRESYAALLRSRPNIDVVHLFVAAPPSVCLVIGQELRPRNSPSIQTYRYRADAEGPKHTPAILITAAGDQPPPASLTDEQRQAVYQIRSSIWPAAVRDVENYAANKGDDGQSAGPWFISLEPRDELETAQPFPNLPPIAGLIPQGVVVDPEPFDSDYGFEATGRRWRLGDQLLVGLSRAVLGNTDRLRELIRLFLFHEYLHLYHSIGKHTAEQVGKFANCLEHIDYTADTYALLHQLDWMRLHNRQRVASDNDKRRFLADQIELAILSFWAFDENTGSEWQVRRIRRYLNWYWRLVQVENAPDLATTMQLFSRQPRIEIGGLYQVGRGRRVLTRLDRVDPTTHLELAVVLEDERLHRQSDSPNTNLPALLDAFRLGDHEGIKSFFRALYDTAKNTGGVLPLGRVSARHGDAQCAR